jgi:hypothetical protein
MVAHSWDDIPRESIQKSSPDTFRIPVVAHFAAILLVTRMLSKRTFHFLVLQLGKVFASNTFDSSRRAELHQIVVAI